MKKKYKIKYRVESGEFTKDDIDQKSEGLTDAVMLASIVRDEQGNSSTAWVWRDGDSEDGDMKPSVRFLTWLTLAGRLSEDEELKGYLQEFCALTLRAARGLLISTGEGGKDVPSRQN